MVFGLTGGVLAGVVAVPAILGTTEGIRKGQANAVREKERGRKVNLLTSCRTPLGARWRHVLDGGLVVLRNNKLYVDPVVTEELEFLKPAGHPFTGYFLKHPDHNWGYKGEGLVSTIMPDPPQLNWIYVDKDTHEIKYGTKAESRGHILGPWDCTKLERRLLFDNWEGFMVVQENADDWALYFDVDDDGLRSRVQGKRIVEVQLERSERRKPHEAKDERDYL